MIGSKLGDWIIDKELGAGGMGHVYLAHKASAEGDPIMQAAVKILAPELARETGFRQRFEREIEAVRQLDHPNIVRFYEAGVQDGQFYYVMEYVPGEDFDRVLTARGRLDWPEVLDLGLQLAPALKHAHDHGVIHRDIKPHNLLRADDGTVKLSDFGIAKVFAGRQLTTTGTVVGTADYMAPEVATGKPATPRSDLYSFGAVLYVLLTGRPLFQSQNDAELLHKHRFAQFERPRRLVPAIPPEVDELICELLAKDPYDRPANGLILQRKLETARRRAQRRQQKTQAVTGANPDVTGDDEPESRAGPATLISRWVRSTLEDEKHGGPIARLFNRPLVLITLFAVCMGVLIWSLWLRPSADPEALFQRGSELMASRDPSDWDRAWNDYLEPLSREFPDNPHRVEVAQLHQQMVDRKALVRAIGQLPSEQAESEAQRFYERGLERCRRDEPERARAIWQALVVAYQADPAKERWVKLAQDGLARLKARQPAHDRQDKLRQELARVDAMRKAGHDREADDVLRALALLYESDAEARQRIEQARKTGVKAQ